MQVRLMFILLSVVGTTLAGIAVTAALSLGLEGGRPIVLAALAGFVLALPVSWLIARSLTKTIVR